MTARSLFRLALALFPTGLLGAQATVFKSATVGAPGDVWVHPGPGQTAIRPPELQGIELLPVDATGRVPSRQFQPDQPRLVVDLPLASRVVLPQGQGSLYRYRRSAGGSTEFGFFVVRANGLAAFLAAFPGTGPTGSEDPVPNPVALTGQGDAMLVSTTLAAGGDLFEIELATGVVHPLTAGMAPLDFLREGLILLPHWGAALTSRGPLRFVRGGRPLLVPLVPKSMRASLGGNQAFSGQVRLPYYGTGIVASADGSTVALIAGVAPDQAHVFTFRLGGSAVCVSEQPATVAHPGFGTEAAPMLALSPDGGRAAWKSFLLEGNELCGECFTRRVSDQPMPAELQITGDAHFTDTLNDTGVIAFFDQDRIMLLVGESNGAGGVEKGDFYVATLPAGGGAPVFGNLTNTSGDAAAPFLSKGAIETSDGVFQIPGQTGLVYFVDGPSGQGELHRLDGPSGDVELVRSGVAGLDFVERAGSDFVLSVLHDETSERELVRVPFDHTQPTASLGTFALTQTFASHAGSASGTFAGILDVTGGQRLLQISLPEGSASYLPGTAPYGPTLGFDANGSVLAAARNSTTAYFFSWSTSGVVTSHGSGPVQSFVLPAN